MEIWNSLCKKNGNKLSRNKRIINFRINNRKLVFKLKIKDFKL